MKLIIAITTILCAAGGSLAELCSCDTTDASERCCPDFPVPWKGYECKIAAGGVETYKTCCQDKYNEKGYCRAE